MLFNYPNTEGNIPFNRGECKTGVGSLICVYTCRVYWLSVLFGFLFKFGKMMWRFWNHTRAHTDTEHEHAATTTLAAKPSLGETKEEERKKAAAAAAAAAARGGSS